MRERKREPLMVLPALSTCLVDRHEREPWMVLPALSTCLVDMHEKGPLPAMFALMVHMHVVSNIDEMSSAKAW